MKKYSWKYILFVFAFVAVSGCEDYLEVEPLGAPTDANFFNDPANAIKAVNAIYDPLTWGQSGLTLPVNFSHSYEFIVGDILTDDAVKGSTDSDLPGITELEEWSATPANANIVTLWYNPWVGIYRANIALKSLPDAPLEANFRNRLMGEAYFLKGYYYFLLARVFGGVPLLDEPLNPDDIEARNFERASLGETYTKIFKLFQSAIEWLPQRSQYSEVDLGRATQGTARAYLARAMMYEIGTVNQNGLTWDDVYEETNAIITSGQYSLVSNFATIFQLEGENNVESIFEVQASAANTDDVFLGTGTVENRFQNPFDTWGWGFNVPRNDLFDAYADNDPRRPATLMTEGENAYGIAINVTAGNRNPEGILNRKVIGHPDNGPAFNGDGEQNIRKFRYADILLMQAEAEYHRGNETNAVNLVNQVRRRASNSTFPLGYNTGNPSGYDAPPFGGTLPMLPEELSGQALLDAIWLERRLELAMESLRFWDLVRTGRYMAALDAKFGDSAVSGEAMSHSITGLVNPIPLLPIPTTEVVSWGLAQNPGY